MKSYLLLGLLLVAFQAWSADYYVSAVGSDANRGTSSDVAWKTLIKVTSQRYFPGDRIFFRGGDTFHGMLHFSASSHGTPAAPIEIGSFGKGRAVISNGKLNAFMAYNMSGLYIHDLSFKGAGQNVGESSGMIFYNDLPDDKKLPFLRLENIEISEFGDTGLIIGGGNGASGYDDVRISKVEIHDNGDNGIFSYGLSEYSHTNVKVSYAKVYNNSGRDIPETNTGSGIVLSSVNHGVIERSVAYNNGYKNIGIGGPIGIWTYASNDVVIQYNESYGNRTNSEADGGGFDLDGGVTNSVMQYNYSHDNEGAGFLVCQYRGGHLVAGNIVRYNISQNDGRKNGYGGITVFSIVHNTEVYNNTVFMSPSTAGVPAGVKVASWDGAQLHFRNNIIVTTGGIPLVATVLGDGLIFQGNNYWSSGGKFGVDYGTEHYDSFEKWIKETGQETLKGTTLGSNVDPMFIGAGKGQTLGDADKLASLSAYQLSDSSPLIARGIDLQNTFGTSMGAQDYFGNALDLKVRPSVGAQQKAPILK